MEISRLHFYPTRVPIIFVRQNITREIIIGVFLSIIENVRHYLRIVTKTELIPRDECE